MTHSSDSCFTRAPTHHALTLGGKCSACRSVLAPRCCSCLDGFEPTEFVLQKCLAILLGRLASQAPSECPQINMTRRLARRLNVYLPTAFDSVPIHFPAQSSLQQQPTPALSVTLLTSTGQPAENDLAQSRATIHPVLRMKAV